MIIFVVYFSFLSLSLSLSMCVYIYIYIYIEIVTWGSKQRLNQNFTSKERKNRSLLLSIVRPFPFHSFMVYLLERGKIYPCYYQLAIKNFHLKKIKKISFFKTIFLFIFIKKKNRFHLTVRGLLI